MKHCFHSSGSAGTRQEGGRILHDEHHTCCNCGKQTIFSYENVKKQTPGHGPFFISEYRQWLITPDEWEGCTVQPIKKVAEGQPG